MKAIVEDEHSEDGVKLRVCFDIQKESHIFLIISISPLF